jgi:FG-GAP-like repeat
VCPAVRIAVIFATVLSASLDASAGQFKRAVYYRAGRGPYMSAAAQFTQSGNLDLVFPDYDGGQVTILLGNGDGTFKPPRTFPDPNPFGLAVGDFNEDGNLDLAVVEPGSGTGAVAIFLGDGKGGFKLSARYAIGAASGRIAVGDFDGDGHLDIAVTNSPFTGTGSVMTFFGDGHGEFHGRRTYRLPGRPFGIAVGDVNGDHHPDLAVTQVANGTVAVFLNDGTGKFLKPVTYNAGGGEVVDVKIADLRNNGRNDLVIADLSAGMVVLLNNGDGTFGKPTVYPPCAGKCSAGPEACTVADFNLDGKLDVACSASIDDSYFFYGKGNGTFGTAIAIADTIKNQGGYGIASGNFITGDSAPDLAIPIQDDGKVAILLNTK